MKTIVAFIRKRCRYYPDEVQYYDLSESKFLKAKTTAVLISVLQYENMNVFTSVQKMEREAFKNKERSFGVFDKIFCVEN